MHMIGLTGHFHKLRQGFMLPLSCCVSVWRCKLWQSQGDLHQVPPPREGMQYLHKYEMHT